MGFSHLIPNFLFHTDPPVSTTSDKTNNQNHIQPKEEPHLDQVCAVNTHLQHPPSSLQQQQHHHNISAYGEPPKYNMTSDGYPIGYPQMPGMGPHFAHPFSITNLMSAGQDPNEMCKMYGMQGTPGYPTPVAPPPPPPPGAYGHPSLMMQQKAPELQAQNIPGSDANYYRSYTPQSTAGL